VIPADELARLFQPFQRLSHHPGPSDDGFGLGLAIVRAIANAHDAAVTAQAPTGGGLRIDIDFPTETPLRLEVVHGGAAAATAVGHEQRGDSNDP
jgi:signal transduction histidine kinase